MNLYVISQDHNHDYDTFDSAVVAAESEENAKITHPYGEGYTWSETRQEWGQIIREQWFSDSHTWANLEYVSVKLIGKAAEGVGAGVILASFNAG